MEVPLGGSSELLLCWFLQHQHRICQHLHWSWCHKHRLQKVSEDVIGVNTLELAHAPSILIMKYGQRVWIHGTEAVFRIASSLIYII